MGSKVEAPDAPDYTPIAQANEAASERSFELMEEQLQFAKDQYAQMSPYAFDYLDAQTKAMQQNQEFGQQQMETYGATYAPIEQQFARTALDYNSPERAAQNAAMARKDVSTSIDAQRQAALTNLQSYGIDPSTTRYGALDASYRISKAAAEAAASTQSRLNTEATGLALQGEAINIGRGYPGAIASSYNTATQAGAAGNKAVQTGFATGADAMGSPTSYGTQGFTGLNQQAGALNMGYNNALAGAQMEAKSAGDTIGGIGNLIGASARLIPLIPSDRRLKVDDEIIGYFGRLPIHMFKYLGDDKSQYGFMADEVRRVAPGAVVSVDGFDMVDYNLAIAAA
jgi:hypothetical protein